MRLCDLVKIDHRFEKSVNLLLDLDDRKKLKLYIPTRSSVNLLKEYLSEVCSFSGKRANILIGPYGKGKSHLLLVLMALLSSDESPELKGLIEKIADLDAGAADGIGRVYKKKKLLPVIINPSSGTLAQAFVRSISKALKRENLSDIVPDSYFSEAVRTIERWKDVYPVTYKAFMELAGGQQADLVKGLKNYDHDALKVFRELYPKLTSGSSFNPVVDDDVLAVYRSVNRMLCEKVGYDGIYIIFDEFSKYIEGHTEAGFSADMKTLQDICELCNSSRDEQLHLTCVAHKAIRAYGEELSKEVRNAFRGVEGRLDEKQFIVSSQNNYELIADAIGKTPVFESWKNDSESYAQMLEDSYQVKDLTSLFDRGDFEEIAVKGTFPLTPLSALLLLGLSEKIAQNERTIFTFLTGKDRFTLASFVERCKDTAYAGASIIYDYFSQLLAEEKDLSVHNEWLKAEYALKNTDVKEEQDVIKAAALIRMVNRPDSIPVTPAFIRLASGLKLDVCLMAVASLQDKKLLREDETKHVYDFANSVDIDMADAVSDCIVKYYSNISVADALNRFGGHKYILPKKYNQDHFMTRYYQVHAMTEDSFLALSSASYLPKEKEPDGYLLVILHHENLDLERITQHVIELQDETVSVAVAGINPDCTGIAQKLMAVTRLGGSKEFLQENGAMEAEILKRKAELQAELERLYGQALDRIRKVYMWDALYGVTEKGLNRTISDIAEHTYHMTPVINHELINRHNVSPQISKARNIIVDDMLHSRLFDRYETGTSAESTVYRACMIHTKNDENLQRVRAEITAFIHESKGQKRCFAELIERLTKPPVGMRKGTLPIYITEQIMQLDDMPVIYHDKTEVAIDAKLMSDIISMPEHHYLYVETETAEKLEYIEGLTTLFSEYGEYCREIENMNRLARIKCFIQAWYRSLPQAATTFKDPDYEGQNMKNLTAFRKLLVGEPNPRELIFERIPNVFCKESLDCTLAGVAVAKHELDAHAGCLKRKAEMAVRSGLGLSETDDFRLSLKHWYEDLPEKAKNSLLPASSQALLCCIRDETRENGSNLIEKLSKAATNFYVEDWNDGTLDVFRSEFEKLSDELKKKKGTEEKTGSRITITAEDGTKECFYDFNPDELSSTGYFFQNALDDMMEDYGDAVDNNEKIGILMNMVKKLMG